MVVGMEATEPQNGEMGDVLHQLHERYACRRFSSLQHGDKSA